MKLKNVIFLNGKKIDGWLDGWMDEETKLKNNATTYQHQHPNRNVSAQKIVYTHRICESVCVYDVMWHYLFHYGGYCVAYTEK